MTNILHHFISALLQLIIFILIPFTVYLVSKKSVRGFFDYIGLKRSEVKANYIAVAVSLVFLIIGVSATVFSSKMRELLTTPPSITGEIKQMGLSLESVGVLLLIACFKTSLGEEILFRGFIAKRLINKLGYQTGNILQAIIFALIHVILFWLLTKADIAFSAFIFVLTGTVAYVIGYINEKIANGSIIPGWIAHGLGNTLSYFIIAFVI